MSLTLPGRSARPARKHRAIDRLAQREQELAELQQRLDDADALIMRQAVQLGELQTENERLTERLQETQDALINIGRDRDALERYVHDLEGQVADRDRRLDVRTWAHAAVAKTQEMAVVVPVPLHQSPMAEPGPDHALLQAQKTTKEIA
ncbi:hypothetical protein [Streptomyces echinatus]|uniref:Septal ring factor EnvC (AmiA/AmiB activator) n=1 Tax=Streptomyces echinatus TaxID=67293 RepID=A0A7W9Q2G8_9ACTN|nr:hypothetical protein [Streptomyces echinatus]MBB5932374.1 septal ring factor EnvC (AmiA/AmiB activator) [Streptomyces echinatus]